MAQTSYTLAKRQSAVDKTERMGALDHLISVLSHLEAFNARFISASSDPVTGVITVTLSHAILAERQRKHLGLVEIP